MNHRSGGSKRCCCRGCRLNQDPIPAATDLGIHDFGPLKPSPVGTRSQLPPVPSLVLTLLKLLPELAEVGVDGRICPDEHGFCFRPWQGGVPPAIEAPPL